LQAQGVDQNGLVGDGGKPFSSAKRRLLLAKRLRIGAVSNRAGSKLSSGFMAGVMEMR